MDSIRPFPRARLHVARAAIACAYVATLVGGAASVFSLLCGLYASTRPSIVDAFALLLFPAVYAAGSYVHEYGHAFVARLLGATACEITRNPATRVHAMRFEGNVGGAAGVRYVLLGGAMSTLALASVACALPLPLSLRAAVFGALFLRTLEELTLADGSDLSRFISLFLAVSDRTLRIGDPVLCVNNVSAVVGERTLVDAASIEIRTGDIVGVLGGNGAGKSTLLDILAGLRVADGGTRELATGARTAYTPSKAFFLQSATIGEMLNYFSAQGGVPRDSAVEERLGLRECVNTRVSNASSGELQRLSLAVALAQRAEVLILDEPETALDPPGRAVVHALLRERRARGKACIMATHFVADALDLCTHLAIMEGGRVVSYGPVETFEALQTRTHRITVWLAAGATQRARDAGLQIDESDENEGRGIAIGTVTSLISIAARLGDDIKRFELESNWLD